MEASKCAQQDEAKSALILFLVKDFHVSLSGREEDWLGSEATTPEEQKELEALEVPDWAGGKGRSLEEREGEKQEHGSGK